MSRYIPANAETSDFPAAVVIAYCFEGKSGPAYVAYKLKSPQGQPYQVGLAAKRSIRAMRLCYRTGASP